MANDLFPAAAASCRASSRCDARSAGSWAGRSGCPGRGRPSGRSILQRPRPRPPRPRWTWPSTPGACPPRHRPPIRRRDDHPRQHGEPAMSRSAIATSSAPNAVGPYSQAIVAGDFVFCSGQGAIDAATNEMRHGTIEEETRGHAQEHRRAARRGRRRVRGRRQDHGLPRRHGRLRGDERGLRRGVPRPAAGALHRRRGRPAEGLQGGDRGRRLQAAGRLTPRTSRPYDAAHLR